MAEHPLLMLQKYGQSFWYDNISRELIRSGELKRMVQQEGLKGVTSNPTIFYKAIKSSTEYDERLRELAKKALSPKEIFYELAIEDIRDACDILMDVYRETSGDDGYVSIEVDPHYAYDPDSTVEEAVGLFKKIDRPNLMIKVPATKQGLSAIQELLYRGINVNVTLLFSVHRYDEVLEVYFKALEKRMAEGLSLNSIASVASFFVSRVDTLTDRLLQQKLEETSDPETKKKIKALMGRTAVANAKMAYQVFKKWFSTDRFLKLRLQGARVQRLLFGSTSTKNPEYSDVLYVEELIGPGTVNTMPDATWRAFKDHGRVRRTLDDNVEQAEEVIRQVESLGISLNQITQSLEEEGVRLFVESFDALLEVIEEKLRHLR